MHIFDKEFRMIVNNNYVDVINYKDIVIVSEDKIVIKYDKGKIDIKGKELLITKLLDDELLIKGIITNIEYR